MADKSENYMLWYNIWLAKQANQVIDDAKKAGAPPPSIEDAKKSVKNDPNHEQNWMASDIYKKQVVGPNNQIPRGFNTQDRITTSMVRKRSAQIMKEDPELSEEEATAQADEDVQKRQERDAKDISGSGDPVAAKILSNISSILMDIGEDVLAIRESGPNGLDAAEAAREKAADGLDGKDEALDKAESFVERLAKIVSVFLIPLFLGLMSNFVDLTSLSGILKAAFIGLIAYFASKALLTLIGTALIKLFSLVAGSIGKKLLQLFAPNLLSRFISPKVINAPGAIIYAGSGMGGPMGGPAGGPMGGRAGRDRNRVPNAATQARYARRYGQAAATRRFGGAGGGRFGTILNLFGIGAMTTGGFGDVLPTAAPAAAAPAARAPTVTPAVAPTVTPATAVAPTAARVPQPRDSRGRFTKAPTVTPAVPTPAGGTQAAGGILGKAKGLLPAAKSIPYLGTALTLLSAGSVYGAKRDEGKSKTRAGVETAGQVGGGLAGAYGGMTAGAAIGTMIFPGVGTVIGGALGGLVGGMGGAALGDMATSGAFDLFSSSEKTPSKKKEEKEGFNPLLMAIPALGVMSMLGSNKEDKKGENKSKTGLKEFVGAAIPAVGILSLASSMQSSNKDQGKKDTSAEKANVAFKDTASGKLLGAMFPALGLGMAISSLSIGANKESPVSDLENAEKEAIDVKKAEDTKKGLEALSTGLDSFAKVIPGVSVLNSILKVLREIFGGDSENEGESGGTGEGGKAAEGTPPSNGTAPANAPPAAQPNQAQQVNPVPTQPMQTERLNGATQASRQAESSRTMPTTAQNTVVQQNAVNNSNVNYSNTRMGSAVQGDALMASGCA